MNNINNLSSTPQSPSSTLNSERPATILPKVGSSKKTSIIMAFKKAIKNWKSKTVYKNSLKVLSYKIDYQLKQFYVDSSGLYIAPFEIIFRKTENKVEDEAAHKYPEFFTWNVITLGTEEERKRYFEMRGAIERGLTVKDRRGILQFFFDEKLFFPFRRYIPFLDFEIISTEVKPYGETKIPYIVLKGRLYFYGKKWLDEYLALAKVTFKKYFGGRILNFNWVNKPAPFILNKNAVALNDWIKDEIVVRIRDAGSKENKIMTSIFGKLNFKKVKIDASWNSGVSLSVRFDGVYQSLIEKIWNNKYKIAFGVMLFMLLKSDKKKKAAAKKK